MNENTDMIIENVKPMELNTEIASAVLNIQELNMA